MSQKIKVIVVGGFLGAGKTTLLWKAAQQLFKSGKRVGIITNDQAPELVDSALLTSHGFTVAEVSGSCFCCNFEGFINAIQQFNIDCKTDYVMAEPVGSCTDLSATIMQPLKQYWREMISLAPLSVLTDTERLNMILDGGNAGLHEDAAYIFRKQLEESDIIVITKTDLLTASQIVELVNKTKQVYPDSFIMTVSALTGEGVDAWLDEVFRLEEAGNKLVAVDYDVYARGEAVLGWLNGTISLSGKSTDWDVFIRSFMHDLCAGLEKNALPIGHVKAILENDSEAVMVNFTGGAHTFSVRGVAGTSEMCKLIINARVETSPEILDAIVRTTLHAHTTDLSCKEIAWKYLQPGRPNPTYRFNEVVN